MAVYVQLAFSWLPDAYDENDTIKVTFQTGVPGVGWVDETAETMTLDEVETVVLAGLDTLYPENITPE